MGDVIDLVFVQADTPHKIHLNFIGGGQAAYEIGASAAAMLGDGEDRRNIVAGIRVVDLRN